MKEDSKSEDVDSDEESDPRPAKPQVCLFLHFHA